MNIRRQLLLMVLSAVLICFVFAVSSARADNGAAPGGKTGTVAGKFTLKDGSPMTGGTVVFFSADKGPLPDGSRFLRGPDIVVDLNADGTFTKVLPSGKYLMEAIKRSSGKPEIGPPQPGDFVYRKLDSNGNPELLVIQGGEKIDLGVIRVDTPFKGFVMKTDNMTAIEGTILSEDGKPVEGAMVFAFDSPDTNKKALFVSTRTGPDGKYILGFGAGGSYYLKVRMKYGGGTPAEGETLGFYGKESPIAIVIKTGEIIRGIDIRTARIKRGPSE